MYTPDADDAANPLLSTLAGTAQAEFQALKTKLNLLFFASSYSAPLKNLQLNTGLGYIVDLPATTDTGIAYGHHVDITRNDISAPNVQVNAFQMNGRLGNNLNPDGLLNASIFGFASEAWTGEVASQASLIGGEVSVISQANNNIMPLLGLDVTFKNRSDVRELAGLGPAQGLGANKYNSNSRGIQFAGNNRSALYGEYCGWGRGILYQADCLDIWWDNNGVSPGVGKYRPAIGIDFTQMLDPTSVNPWSAHRMSSALALKEYMSVTWDALQQLRSYCDSVDSTLWLVATGGQPALNGNPLVAVTDVFGVKYSSAQLCINTPAGGAPAAADASITILVNNIPHYVHLTVV